MLAPELTLPLGRQGKGVLIPGLPGLEVCRTCEIVARVPLYVPTAWELAAAGESLAQAELLCLVRPRRVSPSRDGFHPVPQRSWSRAAALGIKTPLGPPGLGKGAGRRGVLAVGTLLLTLCASSGSPAGFHSWLTGYYRRR